jgi:RluA family pseudouridine synthase
VEVPEVLFRDGLMLIVNKPPGVPVHAGPSGGPSLEDTFDALRFGLPRPPALAHRLDQDTSGCLVLGRHPKALRRLGKLFSEGRVGKTYWAVTRGRPASDRGRIDFPLLKTSSAKKGWRMVVDESGKAAITEYRVLAAKDGQAWIEFTPRTGRTHQIRVHAAQAGFPILGDPWYGVPEDRGEVAPPLHLHARSVELPLYKSKEAVVVDAPIPDGMHDGFSALGAALDVEHQ